MSEFNADKNVSFIIKTYLKLFYKDKSLPTEYITSYFVPDNNEVLWEIRYKRSNSNSPYKKAMLVKLLSCYNDKGFQYKENLKLNLETGHKVRRMGGDLTEFIGKKVFVSTLSRWHNYSKFFINFPEKELVDSPHRDKIIEIFGV